MLRTLTLPCTSFAWQNEKQSVLMMLSFDTPSVQNKRTMMRMMLACLRQATSNHEATSMALACGRCLRRCIIVPCSQLAVQKSSIASAIQECSWTGSGQTDERFAKVVVHKEHEHHQHHRHAFEWKVAQKAEKRQHSILFGFRNDQ